MLQMVISYNHILLYLYCYDCVANGAPSVDYYLPESTLKTITMQRNILTSINIPLHQIQFRHEARIYFTIAFYFKCKIITINISIQFVRRAGMLNNAFVWDVYTTIHHIL